MSNTPESPNGTAAGRNWILLGAILAGLAVVCGAFAAHGIDAYFVTKYAGESRTVAGVEVPRAVKYLADFRTAAEYQMYHSLALIAVGLWMSVGRTTRLADAAGWCFFAGIVLFSGSLYLLTLTGQTWLGAITPLGGTAFVVGWCVLAADARK
ncbi:MAG: DUF423 domain-containing protein [Planctomycetaceae bacterium]|nr:DUF423 domain-containing protein [Planctomycetaceae bacterium]